MDLSGETEHTPQHSVTPPPSHPQQQERTDAISLAPSNESSQAKHAASQLDFLQLNDPPTVRRISAVPAPALLTDNTFEQPHGSFSMPNRHNNALLSEPLQIVTTEPTPRAEGESSGDDYFSAAPRSVEASPTVDWTRRLPQVSDVSSQAVTVGDESYNTTGPSTLDTISHEQLQRIPDPISQDLNANRSALSYMPRLQPRRSYTEHPNYPNQALSALQHQIHPQPYRAPYDSRPPPLRLRNLQSDHHLAKYSRSSSASGARTVGNTPIHTPYFIAPRARQTPAMSSDDDESPKPSPYLHPVHTQTPKETTRANRDVDHYSGRKTINQYEIESEIGRGTHGKVKLARNLETGEYVAIKIVTRYGKRKRLGKDTNPEDKAKREIAILKKAVHPNVVSMLEVIDDPDINKIYLVLEFCESHDVQWRAFGTNEVIVVEYRRQLRDAAGEPDELEALQNDSLVRAASRRRERAILNSKRPSQTISQFNPGFWSLEYAGESEDDESRDDRSEAGTEHSRIRTSPIQPSHGAPTSTLRRLHDDTAIDDLAPVPEHTAATIPEPTGSVQVPIAAQRSPGPAGDNALFGQSLQSEDVIRRIASEELVQELDLETRGRTSSITESTTSSRITDYIDEELPTEYRYVPLMTLREVRQAFRDALLGLEYLHYQGIVHRDIKPENLLRKADHRVKISDFGVSYLGRPIRNGRESEENSENEAVTLEEETELAKTVGTPAFFAPELCSLDWHGEHKAVTYQIDVWSLGVTLFCLVFARVPFCADNEFQMMRKIAEEPMYIPRKRLKAVDMRASRSNSRPHTFRESRDHRLPQELVYDEIDEELYDLLKRLLVKDPRKRMSLREVKHHPWVLRDIARPQAWLEETDPARWEEGKKIEISNAEVADAVIPLKLIERAKSVAKKVFGLNRSSRRRGQSSAASSEAGTPVSAPPTADSNRSFLKKDDLLHTPSSAALGERSTEHPLSHSVLPEPERRGSMQGIATGEGPLWTPNSSRRHSRPGMPGRQESVMSTAASIRTVKQSDFVSAPPLPSHSTSSSPIERPTRADHLDAPLKTDDHASVSPSSSFKSAGRSFMRSLRSRERRGSGSASPRPPSSDVRAGELAEEDWHGEPSTAVSGTSVTGRLNTPSPFGRSRPVSTVSSASSSKHSSSAALNQLAQQYGTRVPNGALSTGSAHGSSPAGTSTLSANEELHRALRRGMSQHEADEKARSTKAPARSRAFSSASSAPCPPSPDDEIFWAKQQQADEHTRQQQQPEHRAEQQEVPSARSRPMSPTTFTLGTPSSPASPEQFQPLERPLSIASSIASSSQERFFSEASRPTSVPSVPSVVSTTSATYAESGAFNPAEHPGFDAATQAHDRDEPQMEMHSPAPTVLKAPLRSPLVLTGAAMPSTSSPSYEGGDFTLDSHSEFAPAHAEATAVDDAALSSSGSSSDGGALVLRRNRKSSKSAPQGPQGSGNASPGKPRTLDPTSPPLSPSSRRPRLSHRRPSSRASAKSRDSPHVKPSDAAADKSAGTDEQTDDAERDDSRKGRWPGSLRAREIAPMRLQ